MSAGLRARLRAQTPGVDWSGTRFDRYVEPSDFADAVARAERMLARARAQDRDGRRTVGVRVDWPYRITRGQWEYACRAIVTDDGVDASPYAPGPGPWAFERTTR